MCFNFSLSKHQEYIEKRFGKRFSHDGFQPVFHVSGFSGRNMPVVCMHDPETIYPYAWPFIPETIASLEILKKYYTYNAKSETIFTSSFFGIAIQLKRCLVLADGFFEWHAYGSKKYPFYIKLKSGEAFAFAGIYSNWKNEATGITHNTFSIITTRGNQLLEKVHNIKKRMPLIISKNDEEKWIDPKLTIDGIKRFFKPYEDEEMIAYPVEKSYINKGINDPNAIKEISYPGLPSINSR